MTLAPDLVRRFEDALGPGGVIKEPEQVRVYDCDGLTGRRVVPSLVILPETTEEVAAAVRICNEAAVPFVARGAGTGLSGGALPVAEGIVISLARMTRVVSVDTDRGRIVVQPGVTNTDVTRAVAAEGFFYAPDPSSQQVCTIGGNVAENSGGAHCLKYGFTVNHVLAATVVLPDGEVVSLALGDPGPDLLGLFVGSEGTLGIATELTLRVLRRPEAVRTLLAGFPSTDSAGGAVSGTIAAGIMPAAIEMMDRLTIEAAEAAVGAGYPPGAEAVLIVELDGVTAQVEEDLAAVEAICRRERRLRAPHRRGRGRARRGLARAQVRLRRDGPDQPRLLRPGRRRAAHQAARGAAAHHGPLAASTGSGSATCSTRATATSTRSSSTTARSRARRRGPRSSRARSSRRASTPAARSPASTASAPTRRARCR